MMEDKVERLNKKLREKNKKNIKIFNKNKNI